MRFSLPITTFWVDFCVHCYIIYCFAYKTRDRLILAVPTPEPSYFLKNKVPLLRWQRKHIFSTYRHKSVKCVIIMNEWCTRTLLPSLKTLLIWLKRSIQIEKKRHMASIESLDRKKWWFAQKCTKHAFSLTHKDADVKIICIITFLRTTYTFQIPSRIVFKTDMCVKMRWLEFFSSSLFF